MKNYKERFLGNIPKMDKQTFGGGVKGNLDTVSFIKKCARKYSGHPLVRRFSEEILNEYATRSHDHVDEALAIGEYIQKNCRYLKDPNKIEQLQAPDLMIKRIRENKFRGDCDDMVLLTLACLLSVGIEPYVRIVKYRKEFPSFQHIYVVVYERNYRDTKKSRVVLDCIVKDKYMGFEVPHAEGKEIKI
jgi:transglutaminase-like putative cysteine protease